MFTISLFLCLFFIKSKFQSNPLIHKTSICNYINKVEYKENMIHIEFLKSISNIDNISDYFGYQTNAFKMPLTFTPNSFTKIDTTENELFIQFDLPIVQTYNGYLYCSSAQYEEIIAEETENDKKPNHLNNKHRINAKSLTGPKDILQYADSLFSLSFNKTEFDPQSEWSQIECYGETYETRYCKMKNVAIYKDLLVFSTKANYAFPQPFLTLDARSPPFNRKESILGFEPVVLDRIITQADNIFHEQSYLITQFDTSANSIWNVVVDFLIPALVTFESIEKTHEIINRNIVIRDTEYDIDSKFMSCLSKKNPILLWDFSGETFKFDDLVVGLKKLEANPSSARSVEDKHKIKYTFTNETCPFLHDLVFDVFDVHTSNTKDNEYQKILLVENKSLNKTFINQDEIEQYMKASCDICDIDVIDISKMSQHEIMELFSSAYGIVGMHSDDIANAIWMNPEQNTNKFIFELFPHGFNCNKMHKSIAKLNNFKYFYAMGTKIPRYDNINQTLPKQLADCLEDEYLCVTEECYSILENQDLYVDVGTFSYQWDVIVDMLRGNS